MNIPMIDTLIATVDIAYYEDVTKDLINILEGKKIEAKSLASKCSNDKTLIIINDITFEVLANGSKGYAYILHNDDYEVKISQFRSKSKDFYPIYIKIKSESLWSNGPEDSWKKIINWVNKNIGNVISNKINRLDLCCHTDELNLLESDYQTFKGHFHNDQMYRYRRKVNAMTFGSREGKVYCRIYDKTLETRQMKKKMWFFNIWKDRGLNCENIWNVEFEVKRNFFKSTKIDSVEDAFSKIKSIWVYCTSDWIVKTTLDCSRIERSSIDKIWINIQNAFCNYKDEKLVSKETQLQCEAMALIPGTIGNLTSFAARLGTIDIEEVLDSLKFNGDNYLKRKNTDFSQVINEKMQLLNSSQNEVEKWTN